MDTFSSALAANSALAADASSTTAAAPALADHEFAVHSADAVKIDPSPIGAQAATPIGTHREVALRALRSVANDARNDVGARIEAARSLLYADVGAPVADLGEAVGSDVRTGWDDLLSLARRIWRPSLFLAIGAAAAYALGRIL